MNGHPPAIQRLIDRFTSLPGIGAKTAEKLVFFLLQQPAAELSAFAAALAGLPQGTVVCATCFDFAAATPCTICANPRRRRELICVVARPQDLHALEKTGDYGGVYHVLGGALDPIAGVQESNLRLQELVRRVSAGGVQEIILALNPDINGETTTLAIKRLLQPFVAGRKLKLTRLARGLPMGSDLEYADAVTLSNALSGRRDA